MKKVILITGHRRENFGRGFEEICMAIGELANRYCDCLFVYPVHLNPAVQEVAHRVLDGLDNVHLIEPLEVITTHNLMNKCTIVLTDSGGIQEEAPSLGKPVLVLRNETERPEAVTAGTVKVVGTDKDTIVKIFTGAKDEKPKKKSKGEKTETSLAEGNKETTERKLKCSQNATLAPCTASTPRPWRSRCAPRPVPCSSRWLACRTRR